MPEDFPEVQGGGSLILAWQVKNKPVIVVGGGEVAAGRILNLLNADALITLICPSSGLNAEVAHRVRTLPYRITHVDRLFQPSDLDVSPPPAMVLTAVDDPVASSKIYKFCHEKRIPANIADVPPECDFYFGSVHRDGPLQIMVSTNGNGPRLAASIRRSIADSLPSDTGEGIRRVGLLRRMLRKQVPGNEEGGKRMRWMSRVCDEWELEDLVRLEETDMEELLKGYGPMKVEKLAEIRGEYGEKYVWDGSFGWM